MVVMKKEQYMMCDIANANVLSCLSVPVCWTFSCTTHCVCMCRLSTHVSSFSFWGV